MENINARKEMLEKVSEKVVCIKNGEVRVVPLSEKVCRKCTLWETCGYMGYRWCAKGKLVWDAEEEGWRVE